MYVTWLIHTHWCMRHDSFIHSLIYLTCLTDVCDVTHLYIWHDSWMYVTWLIYIYDMTHGCMWRDSFIYMTWLLDVCDVTHLYIWHDALMHVRRLIHMCHLTHGCMWHVSFTHMTWLLDECDMTHPYTYDVTTHSYKIWCMWDKSFIWSYINLIYIINTLTYPQWDVSHTWLVLYICINSLSCLHMRDNSCMWDNIHRRITLSHIHELSMWDKIRRRITLSHTTHVCETRHIEESRGIHII